MRQGLPRVVVLERSLEELLEVKELARRGWARQVLAAQRPRWRARYRCKKTVWMGRRRFSEDPINDV